MKDEQRLDPNNNSAATSGDRGALTRRELMGASLVGAGLLGAAATPLSAESPGSSAAARAGKRIIDSHVHLWKLPRSAAPMSDSATFPTGCCGPVPWMEADPLLPDSPSTSP